MTWQQSQSRHTLVLSCAIDDHSMDTTKTRIFFGLVNVSHCAVYLINYLSGEIGPFCLSFLGHPSKSKTYDVSVHAGRADFIPQPVVSLVLVKQNSMSASILVLVICSYEKWWSACFVFALAPSGCDSGVFVTSDLIPHISG